MSVKSLFIYTLSLTLGIGAVAHAKPQLIELQLQEAAQTEELANRISYAPGHWGRLTV
ncbi:hypothetical protein SynBIOSU31_02994 [Synechococcus sp. BIOS-U3-1]|uniref:hypothetical protein n=1 Tax=Synechococcus sp. BIOS-U3-1 TaxID=1400865 RepID=UPI0016460D30|nr:hypothetical protein [Synechococcus sp. BIOS-U3-1]QNI59848.1 hypothetical protein SynBIOSU31_02994 [Synechococcus sp. BIOS-U3-1]